MAAQKQEKHSSKMKNIQRLDKDKDTYTAAISYVFMSCV